METRQALAIVEALADGVDPQTGEVFASGSVYQRADVIRALFAARDALKRQAKNERRKKNLPDRVGKPWDAAEDGQLAAEFDQGISIEELAKRHERTTGGIRSRLERLGKVK